MNDVTLYSAKDMDSFAQAMVNAKFCGFGNKSEAITLMLIAQSEGRHIGAVARDYHMINGKPTLKADAMLARFQSDGGKIKWIQYSDSVCEAEFTHPLGGTLVVKWTFSDAEKKGLTKNPIWTKFPRQLLKARVISEGITAIDPGVKCGTYTPEEVMDMQPQEPDVQDATVITEPETPPKDEALKSFITSIKETLTGIPKADADRLGADVVKELNCESAAKVPVDNRETFLNRLRFVADEWRKSHTNEADFPLDFGDAK